MAKLKVFEAQFGFYDSVVAVPSQAAALRVWGTHQNLFSSGQARVATDTDAVEAALAQPGVPLRRAVGSRDPYQLVPASLPRAPDAPERRPAPEARRPPDVPSAPPDRSALEAAERRLAGSEERRRAEDVAFADEQSRLAARHEERGRALAAERKSAERALSAARAAYLAAGGAD